MSTGIVMDFMLRKAKGQLELPDLWLNNDIRLIRSRVLRDSKTQDAAVEHADYITLRNVKTVWWILTEYASNFCEEHPMLTEDFPMEMIAELLDMSKTEVVTAIDFLEHVGIIFYDEAEVNPNKWVDCVRTILKPFDACPYNADEGSLGYFFEEEAMEYVNKEIMQTNKHIVWGVTWNHYYSSALDRYATSDGGFVYVGDKVEDEGITVALLSQVVDMDSPHNTVEDRGVLRNWNQTSCQWTIGDDGSTHVQLPTRQFFAC